MLSWQPFDTAPHDREIFAARNFGKRPVDERATGPRFKWDDEHKSWKQFHRGSWYFAFFDPTHWAEIPRENPLPAPMFDDVGAA